MKRLTFRQKLLITYAACALALVFITFVSVSYYINTLQKQNVKDAVELAKRQAIDMAREASQILEAQGNRDYNDPAVQASLRALTRINLRLNKSIVWGAYISPDGERFIEEYGDAPSAEIQRINDTGSVSEVELPSGNDLRVEVFPMPEKTTDVTMPVQLEGGREGKIHLKVVESATFKQIEQSSQRITRALVFGCLLMLLFLLLIFLILWRMFFRQLDLQQKNAALDRMAYVGTLASGLAHEIRNPLSSMNVNLEVIREELAEINSEVAEHAGELSLRVQREVGQLNSTLTSFLDFALPRKEGYSQFSLRILVEELLEAHTEELRVKDISVELEMPSAHATTLEADRRLLHQAIRNILLNAIQVLSGSVKKVIRIQIEPLHHDRIRLCIIDSGPGIREENMDKIFDVFFSTRKGGSGFGLAIARKIIEEHNGHLWAENNAETRGAKFCMELPQLAPQEHQLHSHGRLTWSARQFSRRSSET